MGLNGLMMKWFIGFKVFGKSMDIIRCTGYDIQIFYIQIRLLDLYRMLTDPLHYHYYSEIFIFNLKTLRL